MSDDLVKELRASYDPNDAVPMQVCLDAADRIETLESVMRDDARWLAAYHKWCEMHNCAPSSSDLIAAREAVEGKDE